MKPHHDFHLFIAVKRASYLRKNNIKLRYLRAKKKKNIKLCLDRPLNKLMLHYLSHNYFASTYACLFISRYFISVSAAIHAAEAS